MIFGLPDLIIVAFAGLTFGSFVTLASYRIPRGQDIIYTRSRCTSCGHTLGVKDLVPLFSWLFRGGKCGKCSAAISYRYPLIEIVQALAFVIIFLKYGYSYESLILALLSVCLLIVIVVDFEFTIIPDKVQVAMFLLGIAYQLHSGAHIYQFTLMPIAFIAFGLFLRWIFFAWKRQEALGMGDVKFFAVVGIFLPPELIITFLFASGMIGILIALFWRVAKGEKQFPFGPALAVSLFFCVLFPEWQGVIKERLVTLIVEGF